MDGDRNTVPLSRQIISALDTDSELSVPTRLRISDETSRNLAQIEAFFRGNGYRGANRSHLIRTAVDLLIQGVLDELPEIKDIKLPDSER